ncbi:hypothetical protein PB2503_09219 [Parvularcula bermudensis HTCC2503]|uniref:DUF403 domain-containing protein n=1 Tax=Parvularcula bermudensis (strain ATCC BAA-594 / HTCC2503 / KCTC 12087) TaxID=314260 RepID=E0TD74_PARBH|nr:alpha-E domain-containing protein [Parvularcula bermudensis]ADM09897.1 hypothetical protein PB2503_09219 [Parvularcula bermudensis HTCC2503]
MLSRTAGNLYWVGRYVERCGATARLLDMGARMTMLPGASERGDWQSVLRAAGVPSDPEREDMPDQAEALEHLLLDGENGISVRSCITLARNNGRAERAAMTTAMWEALNDRWRRLDHVKVADVSAGLFDWLDWCQQRTATFRGTLETTMLRDDRYEFVRLGSALERAAMTLRLLEVKYRALLPERDVAGGGRDIYQWTSLLLASSAMRAYYHIYASDYTPWNIADLLVLNRAFPRSIAFAMDEVGGALDRLATLYDQRHPCHDTAAALRSRLAKATMDEIFADGLHEFLEDVLQSVFSLHVQIAEGYGFS